MHPTRESSSIEADAERLPRQFDRYTLIKQIAVGGMAEIYLAKQSGLEGFEKVVVVKRILSHLAQDEEFVSMFLDEARIAAKLSHPNIVQIYDLGKAEGTYFIAMEYVSGRNVQHLISKLDVVRQMIPVEHVLRIIAGVCDGLNYAHGRKNYDGTPMSIIHRDISPQNILVGFAGGVKVVDFGIAKASTQLAQTRAGVLKGKYAYMSPEQVKGTKIDHRSDIFAVGLVMYEMLTGCRAFERESSLKTLKAIVQEKPVNPREYNPNIPMEVVRLLSKALEKNPDKRYKNAQEMQIAIEEYLETAPKKSNNIRLSRFLYDVFEDELASKAGTMVIEDVGEIILPVAAGAVLEAKVNEDVDHHTLSSVLLPQERDPGPMLAEGTLPERGSVAAAVPRKRPPAGGGLAPPFVGERSDTRTAAGGDDDDGKTLPVADLAEIEARHHHKQQAALVSAPAPEAKTPEEPQLAVDPDSHTLAAGDAAAIRLLAKVDALAAPTSETGAVGEHSHTTDEAQTGTDDHGVLPPVKAVAVEPAPRREASARTPRRQSDMGRLLYTAAAAAVVLAAVMLVLGLLSGTPQATADGLAVFVSEPVGAVIVVDGDKEMAVHAPAQLSLPAGSHQAAVTFPTGENRVVEFRTVEGEIARVVLQPPERN